MFNRELNNAKEAKFSTVYGAYSSGVASKITIFYLVLGGAWITFSDNIVLMFTESTAILSQLQTIKGWFYIILTSLILFLLIKSNVQKLEKTKEKLLITNSDLEATVEELIAIEDELKEKLDELKDNQQSMRMIQERYRLAIEGANDGIWDWDIRKNLFYFERTKKILGYKENELENNYQTFISLVHPEDLKLLQKNLKEHFERRTPYYICEYRLRTRSGSYKWILSRGKTIWDEENSKPIRMAGSHKDVTDRKRQEEKIYQLAYYDSLTALPNRAYFMDSFKLSLLEAKGYNQQVGILFLDIDNFKRINDTLGHLSGDEVLVIISKVLSSCLKENETVFRLGGDEFLVLQTEASEAQTVETAERIVSVLRTPIRLQGHEFYLTSSIGIAIFPQHGEEEEALFRNADTAMYKAKELGKNGYQLFTSSINEVIMRKMEIEGELRHAIERNELVLYYQPIMDTKTGDIVSAEALLRWVHPLKGIIPPMEFIPVAEESGLIREIGNWVIREACRQNSRWQQLQLPHIRVAVNISAYQFQQKNLLDKIIEALDEAGLEPSYLSIEITETVAMEDLSYTTEIVRKMTEHGLSIALDDFGTGYSSLNYLKTLPINTVKIDKTFIQDLDSKRNEKQIAQAIITLAHSLNCKVTAEGVEKREELEFLKHQNCDFVQGFLFHKPLPPGELEEVLRLLDSRRIM